MTRWHAACSIFYMAAILSRELIEKTLYAVLKPAWQQGYRPDVLWALFEAVLDTIAQERMEQLKTDLSDLNEWRMLERRKS